MKIEELKDLCKEYELPVSGRKTELVSRINKYLKSQGKSSLPKGSDKRCGGGGGNAESLTYGRKSAALKMIMDEKQWASFSSISDRDKKRKEADRLLKKLRKAL